jgi:23S rRNA pseudouridine1911/1915/1917 synthase
VDRERPSAILVPHPMKLDIIFEDEDLLVLNKSAGLSVHPGAGTREPTLVEGVFHWLGRSQIEVGDNIRPGIVHRLDKDTTGAIVYAKNEKTQTHLAKQFASKLIPREYLALLDGFLPHLQLEYESYLFRDPQHRKRFASISADAYLKKFGRPVSPGTGYRLAKTLFLRKESFQARITLASIFLRTGRTHQIRVHSKDLHCPVLGDPIYNQTHDLPKSIPLEVREKIAGLKRQMLHAHTLGFIHPSSGKEMHFEAPLPEDFQDLLELLKPLKDENGV